MNTLKTTQFLFAGLLSLFASHLLASEAPYAQIKTVSGQNDRGKFSLQYISLNAPSSEKLNRLLFRELVSDKKCSPDPSQKNNMHYDSKITLKAATPRVLSFTSSDDSYCGGPYPDASLQLYVYDIKRVNKINLMDEVKNKNQFLTYLTQLFQSQFPSSLNKDCKQLLTSDEMFDSEFQFYVDQRNFVIRQSYPHVARACEFNVTLHCKNIKPFLKKNSLLLAYCLEAEG